MQRAKHSPASHWRWPGRTGRVLFVQHQDECPPGHVGDRLGQWGPRVEVLHAWRSAFPEPREFDLIVPLGSYDSAYDDSVPHVVPEAEFLRAAVVAGVPVFGICFGAQLLSRVLGGQVHPAPEGPEVGWLTVDTDAATSTWSRQVSYHGLVSPGPWLVWHLDVMTTPQAGVELARTRVGTQAFAHGPHVGVQFHPEATVDGVRAWADHYGDMLRELGIEPTHLVARTEQLAPQTRRRAYAMTDRVVTRVATAV